MTGVYLAISIGAAGFLIWIFIDYLRVFEGLKLKVDQVIEGIQACQAEDEVTQILTKDANQQVELLKKEIADLEKEIEELSKEVEHFRQQEKRRKPNKFKVEG